MRGSGFAVATDVEPDILLVEFQRKCTERIGSILRRGTTLVLVSHSPQSILQLCESAVWLDEGRVVANGPAPQVVDAFVSRFAPQALSAAG